MNQNNSYDIIKFEDGQFSLDVNVSPNEDTVWLTQKQMALLFDVDRSRISRHINNIIAEDEIKLKDNCNVRKTHIPNSDKPITLYNLDMILAVGYRVNSKRGISFRKWATSILKQYMLKGYSINEKRCLECQDNLISLQNKVNILFNQNQHTLSRLDNLEKTDTILSDKLFYEDDIYDAYSYIKRLFLSAQSSIIIIDGYVDLSVLDMLTSITIPITIYTYPSAALSSQDIQTFNIQHHLEVIRTNIIHDRFIIIDNNIYLCGSSIKDVGKKRFILSKLEFITIEDLVK